MAASITKFGARRFCILCHKFSSSQISQRYYSEVPSAAHTHHAQGTGRPMEELVIPKRRKRDDLAVLRALAATVGKDPTASPYGYHDDPYLLPKTPMEREGRKLRKAGGCKEQYVEGKGIAKSNVYATKKKAEKRYLLSSESGRKAAKLVVKIKPDIFTAYQHDEPKIEAFYPPPTSYVFTEPSEDALMERLDVLDLNGAVEIHQQLVESGRAPSLEVSNNLLEVLCYYNSESPVKKFEIELPQSQEGLETGEVAQPVEEPHEAEEPAPPRDMQPVRRRQLETWKDGDENAGQVLFDSLERPDNRSYNAMIRGMIKHGASGKAFNLFNQMQERGVETMLEGYNALISAVMGIRQEYRDRWDVLLKLMKQMEAEKIRPNLQTFNNLLNSLGLMGELGRKKALQTLSEMKAVNVEPSLGTYSLLLNIFYKENLPPNDILYEIMDTIEGQEFTYQEPNDVHFFKNAMNICFNLKDVSLAYQLDALLNTGENYRLSGDYSKQSLYYYKFLHLICLMDSTDAMFEYYQKFVPGGFVPNNFFYMDMMRSMQTAGDLDKLSLLWKDMCLYGLRYKQDSADHLLHIMATAESGDNELLEGLGTLAKDVQAAHQESLNRREPMRWSNPSLTNLLVVYIRAEDKDSAWSALNLYQKQKLSPGQAVLEDFITLCLKSKDIEKAMDCLTLAVKKSLAFAPALAGKVKQYEDLTAQRSQQISRILEGEEDVVGEDG